MVKKGKRRPVPPTGVGGGAKGSWWTNHARTLIAALSVAIYFNSLYCDFVFGKFCCHKKLEQ